MKLSEITNLSLIGLIENSTELFKLKQYRDKNYVDAFLGLGVHRSSYYGILKQDGTTTHLLRNQTTFNKEVDVNLLIEGVVKLNQTPVNNGSGSIVYSGYGVLEVNDVVIYDGRGGDSSTTLTTAPDELVFSNNYRYTLPIGDKALTLADFDDVLHSSSGYVTIEIIKAVDDDDTYTLVTSNHEKELIGTGFTEGALYNYTFEQATNSASTKYHYTTLKAFNGRLISATNEVSQITEEVPFTDIPDEPTNFAYWKRNTGIVDSTNFEWTDEVSGLVLTSAAYAKPSNSGGDITFNGVDDGLSINSGTINGLMGSLPTIAAYHYTVQFSSFASSVIPVSLTDTAADAPIFNMAFANTSSNIGVNLRTVNPSDAVSDTGATTLSTGTWYTISIVFKSDNTVDVYLDGSIEISDLDISSLTDDTPLFNHLGLGVRTTTSGSTYYAFTVSELVIASSLDNLQNTMDKLVENHPA